MEDLNQLRKKISDKMSIHTHSYISEKLGYTTQYLTMLLKGKREPKDCKQIFKKIIFLLSMDSIFTGKQVAENSFDVEGMIFEGNLIEAIKKYVKTKPEETWEQWLQKQYKRLKSKS